MDLFGIFTSLARLAASVNKLADTADEINANVRQHADLDGQPSQLLLPEQPTGKSSRNGRIATAAK